MASSRWALAPLALIAPVLLIRAHPNGITLSGPTSVVAGGDSTAPVSLDIDTPAEGPLVLRPASPGIIFLPDNVTIPSGKVQSGEFTIRAGADAALGESVLKVDLIGPEMTQQGGILNSLTVSGSKLTVARDLYEVGKGTCISKDGPYDGFQYANVTNRTYCKLLGQPWMNSKYVKAVTYNQQEELCWLWLEDDRQPLMPGVVQKQLSFGGKGPVEGLHDEGGSKYICFAPALDCSTYTTAKGCGLSAKFKKCIFEGGQCREGTHERQDPKPAEQQQQQQQEDRYKGSDAIIANHLSASS